MGKRIVIIGPAYPLRGGGIATFNERLARQLQTEGHEVFIYTFSLQYPGFLFPGKTQYSDEPAPADLNIRVTINSMWPYTWLKTGYDIARLNPSKIIVRFWLPLMGPALGTILRVVNRKSKATEIICIADNIIPHEKRPGDRPFTKYFLKYVHRVIVMSDQVMQDLKFIAPKRQVKLTPHPLYDNFGEKVKKTEARMHLQIAADTKLLLFFGFIRKYKGLDLLLEAIKILKEKGALPELKLVIAGEFYEDSAPYLQQIADAGLSDSIILKTDFVPDAEVRYLFSAADLVVQPYRSATQSGVTPLAHHFEVPTLVTNVGGLPAMTGEAGIVVEPIAEAIADGIVAFYADNPDRFNASIRAEKSRLSWTNFVKAVLQ